MRFPLDDNNGRAIAALRTKQSAVLLVTADLELPDRQPRIGDPDAARYSKWEFVISRVRVHAGSVFAPAEWTRFVECRRFLRRSVFHRKAVCCQAASQRDFPK
jgi:hypothetical protein